MPNRTKSVHKNMPTFGQKRPAVRLCGGGKNRPDAADEKPARQRPLCADVRHPAIFGILCEKYGFSPSDAVFIDDSEKNVEGAKACGFRTIHYTGQDFDSLYDEIVKKR